MLLLHSPECCESGTRELTRLWHLPAPNPSALPHDPTPHNTNMDAEALAAPRANQRCQQTVGDGSTTHKKNSQY